MFSPESTNFPTTVTEMYGEATTNSPIMSVCSLGLVMVVLGGVYWYRVECATVRRYLLCCAMVAFDLWPPLSGTS